MRTAPSTSSPLTTLRPVIHPRSMPPLFQYAQADLLSWLLTFLIPPKHQTLLPLLLHFSYDCSLAALRNSRIAGMQSSHTALLRCLYSPSTRPVLLNADALCGCKVVCQSIKQATDSQWKVQMAADAASQDLTLLLTSCVCLVRLT